MFTGLIQGQGRLDSLQSQGQDMRLHITTHFALDNLQLGESIAVNGVCLTVESGNTHAFSAYVSAESLAHTNLGALRQGALVNLERALAVGDRLGGHIVSGHVDCVATVADITPAGQSRCITLHFPAKYSPEIITKGSVTLDGISLTINACGQSTTSSAHAASDDANAPGFLQVNVIPETWEVTTVGQWRVGTQVNLETDIIGKYVRHMLSPFQEKSAPSQGQASAITENLLQKHGFI